MLADRQPNPAKERMKVGDFQFDPSNPAVGLASLARMTPHDPALPSVLCLSRPQFSSDLYALRKSGFSSRYGWLELQSRYLTEVQSEWVLPQLQVQRYDQGPQGEEGWTRCAEFGEALLKKLRTRTDLVAVMSANFDYWIDEGLRRACKALGIPFLILLREVCLCRSIADSHYRTYTFRPDVDGVAVAGETTKDMLLKWRLAQENKIFVTGLPRFDWWLRKEIQPWPRECIVLFTFAGSDYLAEETFYETLEQFVYASIRHKDRNIDFVVKCKHDPDRAGMEMVLASRFPDHNITLVVQTVFPGLLGMARGIIGFNSLAMVESCLSQAPLYNPYWGDATTPDQVFTPADHEAAKHITFLRSPAALAATLDRLAAARPEPAHDPEQRLAIVQRYIDFAEDRPATPRIDDFVDAFRRS